MLHKILNNKTWLFLNNFGGRKFYVYHPDAYHKEISNILPSKNVNCSVFENVYFRICALFREILKSN